jgi:hypothetical protein
MFGRLLAFASMLLSVANAGQRTYIAPSGPNACVNFQIGANTGCDWMCNYCANQLGTNNYYFTTGVCSYQSGGCVGNPQTGVTYTCCAV